MSERGFADLLAQWFAAHKRPLPFRDTPDAYRVWLSEILGQQTRMTALLPYYERFLARFPTVEALAAAEEEEVLSLWAGLGYYARARNLHRAAKTVAEHYGGQFPSDLQSVRALPGVGDYTAGAVCSIAFGQKCPAVDGNVRRVYARVTARDGGDPAPWIRGLMEHEKPAVITEGLMELGALVCLPAAPRCGQCPVTIYCRAFNENATDKYPAKTAKAPKREESPRCCLIRGETGAILLRRRTERLLRGMWEFPAEQTLRASGAVPELEDKPLAAHKHIFTHIIWHMTLHRAILREPFCLPEAYQWHAPEDLPVFPSAMRPFAEAAREASPGLIGSDFCAML